MIRPRDIVAAMLCECVRATHPSERAAVKRLRREAPYIVDRATRELSLEVSRAALDVARSVRDAATALPGVDPAAVLCALVRELLVDGDGILCTLDTAVRDAGVRHPLDPRDAHHVDALVAHCLGALEAPAAETQAA